MDYLIWLSLKTSHSNHHFTFNRKLPTRENWMKKRAKAIKSSPLFSWFFSVRLICPTSPPIESFFFVCRSEFIKPDNPINKQKPQKKKKKNQYRKRKLKMGSESKMGNWIWECCCCYNLFSESFTRKHLWAGKLKSKQKLLGFQTLKIWVKQEAITSGLGVKCSNTKAAGSVF